MNSPLIEDETLFIPKKRILGVSQLANRIKKSKPSESLEFDMVRISSGSESMPRPPSRIPSLNGSINNPNDEQNIQFGQRLTSIPKPKFPIKAPTSEVRTSPAYNLGSIQSLLNRKGPVLKSSMSHHSKTNSHTNLILNPIFNIEYYNEQEHQLDQQLNSKLDEFKRIDNEVSELRRENHKYKKRFEELSVKLMEKNRRLASLEETITSNVSNQEKLVNIDIQGFQSKLNNELNEIEFSLKNELKQSYLFKDEEIESKILDLQNQVEASRKELSDFKSTKSDLIGQESERLDNELSMAVKDKQNELYKLSNQLASITQEVSIVDEQLSAAKNEISISKNENSELEQSIVNIESNMNNFNDTKRVLLKEISSLDHELSELKQQESGWELTLNNSSKEFEEYNNKLNKFQIQRRILENSIMNYEHKFRVYIKTSLTGDSDGLTYKNKNYNFNKLFDQNESSKGIMDECALFFLSSLKPTTINLSMILSGNNHEQFTSSVISQSYRNLIKSLKNQSALCDVNFSFKSIGIKDHQPFDLLNSNIELSQGDNDSSSSWGFSAVPSQPMILDPYDEDSGSQFDQIINSIVQTNEEMIQIHLVSINILQGNLMVENNLIFLDLTKLEPVIQLKLLNKLKMQNFSSGIYHDKVLQYIHTQCRSINISNLVQLENDDDNEGLGQWLNTLQDLNKIESPWKR